MIFPTQRLALLLILPIVLSLATIVSLDYWPAALVGQGVVLLFAALDLFSIPGWRRFRAERTIDRVLSLGEPHRVGLTIDNRCRTPQRLRVRDDSRPELVAKPAELRLVVPARSRAQVHYTLTPHRRGTYRFEFVYVRLQSRWALWQRIIAIPVPCELRVYPDLKQISRYALYARQNRLSLLGVRKSRRIGSDDEFERLRDYTPDDNYKSLDWRSTARRRRLTVRDYQSSHSQRVVFLVDCGRMMVNEAGGLSLLDHALDATLMLTHIALTRGDSVGVLAFADRVLRWIDVGGGKRHQTRIVHAVHDLYPGFVESRYDLAFLHLHRYCRKRTLVVLITNVIDEVNAAAIVGQLGNLTGRHLPLGVLLRDRELFDAADLATGAIDEPVTPALFTAAAAADIILWRRQVLRNLRHQGVLTLDVYPEDLTAPLINEYLRIKARHLL